MVNEHSPERKRVVKRVINVCKVNGLQLRSRFDAHKDAGSARWRLITLELEDQLARTMIYHTPTQCGREVAAFIVGFYPAIKSSSGSLPAPPAYCSLHQILYLYLRSRQRASDFSGFASVQGGR
ncbi:hypothetical protein EVAR_68623_1 [Eumeta japonica]|uniref:Uncharacterized protein n=1 Tax=Eumeta variegata TaxID=151549 RepID=A0A4C2ABZ4_EUMVA|nr:hypothetical protein EVAR_68623_1 [Eumeta japonica]